MRNLIEEYKAEVYGVEDGNDPLHTASSNIDSSAFIPTPKPRRRRKLFPFNDESNSRKDNEDSDMEIQYYQDPHVSFVVKAVSALTAAFRLVQLEKCIG